MSDSRNLADSVNEICKSVNDIMIQIKRVYDDFRERRLQDIELSGISLIF